MEMWLALRVLRGLDLEEFLEGSAHAYGVVSRLMYRRQWDKLEPLVSPDCLDAMQFTMEQFGDAGQRIEGIDADDAIRVRSNLLCRAQVMKEAGDEGLSSDAPRMSHLDDSNVDDEKLAINDINTNEPVGGFDGGTRQQKSTWRFEGACRRTKRANGGCTRSSERADMLYSQCKARHRFTRHKPHKTDHTSACGSSAALLAASSEASAGGSGGGASRGASTEGGSASADAWMPPTSAANATKKRKTDFGKPGSGSCV